MSKTEDHHDEDEFELSAREAEDYVEQRRQKEILDAAMDVRKTITQTESELARGEIDPETRRAEVRAVVEAAVYEIHHIARDVGADYLLDEKSIYTVKLDPPSELVEYVQNNSHQVMGEVDLARREAYEIEGLEEYLTAPEYITQEWSITVNQKHQRPQPVKRISATRMPVKASKAVADEIRGFLNHVDLDLGPSLEPYDGGEVPGV